MNGFLRLLGLILLIILYCIYYGWKKDQKVKKYRELRQEYHKMNGNYVRCYSINKELEGKAKKWTCFAMLGIYSIILLSFSVICSFYNWKFLPTVFIGIGYYGLFASPLSHVLFGKDFGANALFTWINEKIKDYLYNKNKFYPHLIPVYQRKRDELREEILSVMKEIKS